jgi:hypothetical protein
VEPVGIVTPRAHVIRVASLVYTQKGSDTLGNPEKSSDSRAVSSRDSSDGELNVNSVSADGKELSLQAIASNAARYCP